MNDKEATQEKPTPAPEEPVNPLLKEIEYFANIINSLKSTFRIQPSDGINLLGLVLNYNITLRQMGMVAPRPQPVIEEEENDDGEG